MQANELKQLIEAGLPGCQVQIQGAGDHFEAIVVSDMFEGKNPVQRHQIGYDILGDRMQGEIHVLALHTYLNHEYADTDG